MPELAISPEKVGFLIEKAREFDVKEASTDPDSGSNGADDDMIDVLQDNGRDPVVREITGFIDALSHYGFEGSFQRLGDYQFISEALGGPRPADAPGWQGGNRFGDNLGAGAGVVAGDDDRWRRDLRVLRQRQVAEGDEARQRDDDGQHRGENRSLDKEVREHDRPSVQTRKPGDQVLGGLSPWPRLNSQAEGGPSQVSGFPADAVSRGRSTVWPGTMPAPSQSW